MGGALRLGVWLRPGRCELDALVRPCSKGALGPQHDLHASQALLQLSMAVTACWTVVTVCPPWCMPVWELRGAAGLGSAAEASAGLSAALTASLRGEGWGTWKAAPRVSGEGRELAGVEWDSRL